MAILAAILIMSGAIYGGYCFYSSSQEAAQAKLRLEVDLAAKAGLPTKSVFNERRFGTDVERNSAEAAPRLAPAIQRILAEEAR